jgi:mono/diheme cytochrome c family protein
MRNMVAIAFTAAVSGITGCSLEALEPKTDAVHGQKLYNSQCSQCHGTDAKGAGPASMGLGSPPPELHLLTKNNDGVFPRDYVMGVIDGFSRQGHPTAAMPEFGAGDLGPVIQVEEDGISTPIPSDLIALANYLESIQE